MCCLRLFTFAVVLLLYILCSCQLLVLLFQLFIKITFNILSFYSLCNILYSSCI